MGDKFGILRELVLHKGIVTLANADDLSNGQSIIKQGLEATWGDHVYIHTTFPILVSPNGKEWELIWKDGCIYQEHGYFFIRPMRPYGMVTQADIAGIIASCGAPATNNVSVFNNWDFDIYVHYSNVDIKNTSPIIKNIKPYPSFTPINRLTFPVGITGTAPDSTSVIFFPFYTRYNWAEFKPFSQYHSPMIIPGFGGSGLHSEQFAVIDCITQQRGLFPSATGPIIHIDKTPVVAVVMWVSKENRKLQLNFSQCCDFPAHGVNYIGGNAALAGGATENHNFEPWCVNQNYPLTVRVDVKTPLHPGVDITLTMQIGGTSYTITGVSSLGSEFIYTEAAPRDSFYCQLRITNASPVAPVNYQVNIIQPAIAWPQW